MNSESKRILCTEHLDVSYGKSKVVYDVSFDVDFGKKVVILGRNGVGKTTLLKGIIGLLPAAQGTISFMGKNITGLMPSDRVKLGLAYVPQGREIIPDLSVLENLELGAKNPKKIAENKEKVLTYFPVLKDHLSRKGGVLSGGQQQQLAIGRALMGDPTMLLLDEPTEGIQPNVVFEISVILNQISQDLGISILFVEQNIRFAKKLADEFLIIQKGSIVSAGEMSELSDALITKYLTV